MHLIKRSIAALCIILLTCGIAMAGSTDVAQGKAIYLQYCASCHGPNGEGNGPLAPMLTTPPANLRKLYQRYGNPLPEDQIARFIDGRSDVRLHGPRDMPVWGERFYVDANGNAQEVKSRIAKLVAFLQSIQSGTNTAMR